LRERRDDIATITEYKLKTLNFANLSEDNLAHLSQQLAPIFQAYEWPGNIRELENIVERLLVYCSAHQDVNTARVAQLLDELAPELFTSSDSLAEGALAKNEQQLLQQAMKQFNGNKELVAQFLGISQTTLWRRLKTAQTKTH
jgi:propionate catabolism operon transcriptional regulator